MKNWKAALAALGGIAAVIIISAFGATSGGTQPYKTEYMASWMQAVGSIGAIVGAFLVAQYQTQKQAQQIRDSVAQARLAEGELAYVFANDALAAIFVANSYVSEFTSGKLFSFDLTRLSDAQASLTSLYGRSLPAELLTGILELQRIATYTAQSIRELAAISGPVYLHPDERRRATDRMLLTDRTVKQIRCWLNDERAKHGMDPVPDIL